MSYNITTLLNDIASVIHGTKTNKIPNLYGHINRAARQVVQDIDIKETIRIVQMPQVFNSVYDYPLAVDVKGDRIIDLRPQAGRSPSDLFIQEYAASFDSKKALNSANKIHVQYNTGVKTVRIEAPTIKSPLVITDTSSITGWTASATAQNISLNTSSNVAGGGAIQFDLAGGSTTGSVQTSSLTPLDLSANANIDTLFFWVYLPNGSGVTSLAFSWGSDITANYYTYTTTVTQQGTAFVDGNNLIAIPWASATKVGTPVLTSIKAVKLLVDYNGTAQTGLKLCNITSNTGAVFEMEYYSKFLFRDPSTNAFQETLTDSSDDNKLINLDTETYNLLFNKTASFIAQALQGADAAYDAVYFDAQYEEGLKKYKANNPSEALKKGEQYYTIPRKSYNRYNPGLRRY